MSNSIGVRSTVWSDCHTSLRCGSICREPKSNGVSAEVATVEKSATEARAVTVFAKTVSSPSLNDRIINFPCNSLLELKQTKKNYIRPRNENYYCFTGLPIQIQFLDLILIFDIMSFRNKSFQHFLSIDNNVSK